MRFFNVNKNTWVDLKDKEYFRTPEGIVVDTEDSNMLFTEQSYDEFIRYIEFNKNDTRALFETFIVSMAKFAKNFETRRHGMPIGLAYKKMLHQIDEEISNNTTIN